MMKKPEIWIEYIPEYEEKRIFHWIEEVLKNTIPAGLKKEVRILLKPNVTGSKEVHRGRTTHPVIIKCLIISLKKLGYNNIVIADSSVIAVDTKHAFEVTGIKKVAEETSVELYDLKQDKMIRKEVPFPTITDYIFIAKSVLEAEFLINVPKLKTTYASFAGLGMKNLKGVISDSDKIRFHHIGVHKAIVDLCTIIKPQLTIIDGIIGSELGTPVNRGILIAGRDPIAVDSIGSIAMGLNPLDTEHIKIGYKKGLGIYNINDILLHGDKEILKISTSFKSAPNGIQNLTQNPGFTIVGKNPCSGCLGCLEKAFSEYTETSNPIKLDIVGCSIGHQPDDTDYKSLFKHWVGIGNCVNQWKHTLNGPVEIVKGCPPTIEEIVTELVNVSKKIIRRTKNE